MCHGPAQAARTWHVCYICREWPGEVIPGNSNGVDTVGILRYPILHGPKIGAPTACGRVGGITGLTIGIKDLGEDLGAKGFFCFKPSSLLRALKDPEVLD